MKNVKADLSNLRVKAQKRKETYQSTKSEKDVTVENKNFEIAKPYLYAQIGVDKI